jgi:hypothetical protein
MSTSSTSSDLPVSTIKISNFSLVNALKKLREYKQYQLNIKTLPLRLTTMVRNFYKLPITKDVQDQLCIINTSFSILSNEISNFYKKSKIMRKFVKRRQKTKKKKRNLLFLNLQREFANEQGLLKTLEGKQIPLWRWLNNKRQTQLNDYRKYYKKTFSVVRNFIKLIHRMNRVSLFRWERVAIPTTNTEQNIKKGKKKKGIPKKSKITYKNVKRRISAILPLQLLSNKMNLFRKLLLARASRRMHSVIKKNHIKFMQVQESNVKSREIESKKREGYKFAYFKRRRKTRLLEIKEALKLLNGAKKRKLRKGFKFIHLLKKFKYHIKIKLQKLKKHSIKRQYLRLIQLEKLKRNIVIKKLKYYIFKQNLKQRLVIRKLKKRSVMQKCKHYIAMRKLKRQAVIQKLKQRLIVRKLKRYYIMKKILDSVRKRTSLIPTLTELNSQIRKYKLRSNSAEHLFVYKKLYNKLWDHISKEKSIKDVNLRKQIVMYRTSKKLFAKYFKKVRKTSWIALLIVRMNERKKKMKRYREAQLKRKLIDGIKDRKVFIAGALLKKLCDHIRKKKILNNVDSENLTAYTNLQKKLWHDISSYSGGPNSIKFKKKLRYYMSKDDNEEQAMIAVNLLKTFLNLIRRIRRFYNVEAREKLLNLVKKRKAIMNIGSLRIFEDMLSNLERRELNVLRESKFQKDYIRASLLTLVITKIDRQKQYENIKIITKLKRALFIIIRKRILLNIKLRERVLDKVKKYVSNIRLQNRLYYNINVKNSLLSLLSIIKKKPLDIELRRKLLLFIASKKKLLNIKPKKKLLNIKSRRKKLLNIKPKKELVNTKLERSLKRKILFVKLFRKLSNTKSKKKLSTNPLNIINRKKIDKSRVKLLIKTLKAKVGTLKLEQEKSVKVKSDIEIKEEIALNVRGGSILTSKSVKKRASIRRINILWQELNPIIKIIRKWRSEKELALNKDKETKSTNVTEVEVVQLKPNKPAPLWKKELAGKSKHEKRRNYFQKIMLPKIQAEKAKAAQQALSQAKDPYNNEITKIAPKKNNNSKFKSTRI